MALRKHFGSLMKFYGLDTTRGGNFVMQEERTIWWVPPHLMKVPRFTEPWNLNATNFKIAVEDNPIFDQFKKLHF